MTPHDEDDYLWDRSGTDPDVERLEKLLAPLGHDPARRPLPEAPPVPAPANRPWRGVLLAALLSVAAVAAAAIAIRPPVPTLPDVMAAAGGWQVQVLDGAPLCGDRPAQGDKLELAVGDWLETDGNSRARVEVADIGTLDVDPDTRLRLVATGAHEHRLELARGQIQARVVAPPRLLVVDTPSATAVDLGCAYTLAVFDDGSSAIEVQSGFVSLEHGDRTSLVPAGARALTRPGIGPGTPWFTDADPAVPAALRRIDFDGDVTAVPDLLAAARPRDTLSLVHVLERVPEPSRGEVLDRIEALVPGVVGGPRPDVARADVLALRTDALTALLDDVSGVW